MRCQGCLLSCTSNVSPLSLFFFRALLQYLQVLLDFFFHPCLALPQHGPLLAAKAGIVTALATPLAPATFVSHHAALSPTAPPATISTCTPPIMHTTNQRRLHAPACGHSCLTRWPELHHALAPVSPAIAQAGQGTASFSFIRLQY